MPTSLARPDPAHGPSRERELRILIESLATVCQAEAIGIFYSGAGSSALLQSGTPLFPVQPSAEGPRHNAPWRDRFSVPLRAAPGDCVAPTDLETLLDEAEVRLAAEGKVLVRRQFANGCAWLVVDRERSNTVDTASALTVLEQAALLERKHRQSASLSARHVLRREQEALALAKKVHDELCQDATLLRLGQASLADRLGKSNPALRGDMQDLIEVTKRISAVAIEISENLRPPLIESVGPVPALRQMAKRFQTARGIEAVCELDESELPAASSLAFYRIAQEFFARVVTAHRVTMRLAVESGSAVLRLTEEVDHLYPDHDSRMLAIGMDAMRERALLAGGSLEVESTEKQTCVLVRLPAKAGKETHE